MKGFELNSSGSELRPVVGCYEYGDVPAGSINLDNLLTI
jgi:hypothetical protein